MYQTKAQVVSLIPGEVVVEVTVGDQVAVEEEVVDEEVVELVSSAEEEGHMSRDCTESGGGGRGGRGGAAGGSRACFKCGQEGHMSRECPNSDSGGGASR